MVPIAFDSPIVYRFGMESNLITKTITTLGTNAVARQCCVAPSAVVRWKANGRLPRTDFSGETNYAWNISVMDGCTVDAKQLLEASYACWSKR